MDALQAGDIVVHADATETGRAGLRYRVEYYKPDSDWIHLHIIRKDGQPDRRWRGFSGNGNGQYVRERRAEILVYDQFQQPEYIDGREADDVPN